MQIRVNVSQRLTHFFCLISFSGMQLMETKNYTQYMTQGKILFIYEFQPNQTIKNMNCENIFFQGTYHSAIVYLYLRKNIF